MGRRCKGKGILHPRAGHEGPEGDQRHSFTLYLTSAQDRGVNAMPRPLYAHERDPVTIVQEVGWAPGSVWTVAENITPTGIRSPKRPG